MIDFNKDYILEDSRIKLRPLCENDFPELLKFSIGEPDIWKFNAFGANGEDNLKKYINTALSGRRNGTEYPFVVIDKSSDKIIGSTRFYLINLAYNTLELSFTWYAKKYQGTYVNKVCKFLMLQLAFEDFNLERVGFKANSENIRSINAMKSIGCQIEGTLRNYALDAYNNRINVVVLSILKGE